MSGAVVAALAEALIAKKPIELLILSTKICVCTRAQYVQYESTLLT